MRPKDAQLLQNKLGDDLADRVTHHLQAQRCSLRISRPRKTKYGDFRVRQHQCSISVNEDLNPFRFALTLFHELAHLENYRTQRFKGDPHGPHWKEAYRRLLTEFDVKRLFLVDPQLMEVYKAEWNHPAAQAGLYGLKEQVLAAYDKPDGRMLLSQIAENERFEYRGVAYSKIRDQRSRALCLRQDNQRSYTVSLAARVAPLENNQ